MVIVGGGFGGLTATQALAKAPVDVLLVDRQNHHLFQPLLYQVACAAVSSVEIAAPLRHVLRRQRNATVAMAEVDSIDLGERVVRMKGAVDGDVVAVPYDYLVLAPGAVDNYFGRADWEPLAPGLKSLAQAMEMRSRVLLAFERAEFERDADAQRAWITFVIVGAGPTGVELAGTIKQLAVDAIVKDFRHVDTARARVLLVEAGPRVLPAMHADSSASAERQLAGLGVDVRTNARVVAVTEQGVTLEGPQEAGAGAPTREFVAARTVLWAAGVVAAPLLATLGVELDRSGRMPVQPDLSVTGHPRVFVVGDAATVVDATGRRVPGVAPAAMQMGRHVARCIAGDVSGRAASRPPFRYVDKGSMATIGRSRAVAELGSLHFGGVLAWFTWLFVHLIFLIGFRNRVVVLISWAQSYLFFRAGARVVVDGAPSESARRLDVSASRES